MTPERTVYVVSLKGDLAVLHSLNALLYSIGYKVRVFATEHDFFDACEPGWFGCVIADTSLSDANSAPEPGWFGCVIADTSLSDANYLKFFEHLTARGIDIPVIVTTGCNAAEVDAARLPDQMVALLGKPFRDQSLVDAIEQAFARRQDR